MSIGCRTWTCCLGVVAALSFLGCQSSGQPRRESAAADMPSQSKPRGPAVTGMLRSPPVTGSGLQRATLELEVAADGSVDGSFSGGFHKKPFDVPLSGEVGADGTLSASGDSSAGQVAVDGPLSADGFSGKIAGQLFTEAFELPLAARPGLPTSDNQ